MTSDIERAIEDEIERTPGDHDQCCHGCYRVGLKRALEIVRGGQMALLP